MVVLQEGDMAVYERTTHWLYFMRGADVLSDGDGNGKSDIGNKKLAEVRDAINEKAKPFKLVAELFRERQESCLFQLKSLQLR